jgi:hypothetical protein
MREIKLQDVPLQPLRISSGWNIVYNHFCDIDPGESVYIDGLPNGDVWELFLQDLLLIENNHLNFTLDLGWSPEANPSGKYALTLIKNTDWNNPIAFYESQSKSDIVDKINAWMSTSSINETSEKNLVY